jgi:acyl-CoA hydrolase
MTTEVIEAVVDQITYTNSAFATSVTTGEVVFVNSRIVNAGRASDWGHKKLLCDSKLP